MPDDRKALADVRGADWEAAFVKVRVLFCVCGGDAQERANLVSAASQQNLGPSNDHNHYL